MSARVAIVHADGNTLSDHAYAAALADRPGVELVVLPGASHSWPMRDHQRFVRLVDTLLAEPPPAG